MQPGFSVTGHAYSGHWYMPWFLATARVPSWHTYLGYECHLLYDLISVRADSKFHATPSCKFEFHTGNRCYCYNKPNYIPGNTSKQDITQECLHLTCPPEKEWESCIKPAHKSPVTPYKGLLKSPLYSGGLRASRLLQVYSQSLRCWCLHYHYIPWYKKRMP